MPLPSRRCPTAAFAVLLALAALTAAACTGFRSGSPAPRRVVLLSLDGAGAETLRRLYRDGELAAGGFARFFRDGEVAEALVPVNPTLTATNHISLASGAVASSTGIVSNLFHPAAAAPEATLSGFEAPIATETLWEAARRQHRRVGVLTWPGADDRDERRRGDWGLAYSRKAERHSALATVGGADWQAAAGSAVPSYSSPRVAHVEVSGQPFDLLAIDRTDDGKVNYDGLLVSARGGTPGAPIRSGEWGELAEADRGTASWVKVLALDPQLRRAELYFGGSYRLRAYPAAFAAELAERGLRWPGAPDEALLDASWAGRPGIDLATWSEQSDRFTAFFGDGLRVAAARTDWDLLLGYFPTIDEAGHQLTLVDPRQPLFSAERRDELGCARLRVWQAVDRELARLLSALDLTKTTVVVVSDHGMAPVHTALDPNVLLWDAGLLTSDQGKVVADGTVAYAVSDGGISHLYLALPGADPTVRDRTLAEVRTLFTGWRVAGEAPIERVFTRKEAAEIGLDSPDSGDLILFARPGFTFDADGLATGRASFPPTAYGMHGYLNHHPEMNAIYLAVGAGIHPRNAGIVRNPDVAARIAGWLGIEKPRARPAGGL